MRKTLTSNFMIKRPVGAELSMKTDRRTDMKKLIVPFCSFANTTKNKLRTIAREFPVIRY